MHLYIIYTASFSLCAIRSIGHDVDRISCDNEITGQSWLFFFGETLGCSPIKNDLKAEIFFLFCNKLLIFLFFFLSSLIIIL